ncbi:carbohydrate-binding module family 13 protein [Serpula lacrymans var. lacrymans S7.3]|uniref:Carbohydrate-binding module family 13 protein n=2 Tax=Serpula lacrymans var. lacrymans TaxID=341189 RepID=F8QJ00_SERL3|nr:uncharacterized protein SERLADRAFT_457021 [Serpula lacrymans var. lacrymans S7.9]EGN91712.1 carbohydrate-binding module family 13 protein [Serpula lacrymans var. lacrymans S7.3]EGO29378.1 hypothetical protein SERLADRAFT_457021 [Serpula lacrymans var. lacrymans S7.9]
MGGWLDILTRGIYSITNGYTPVAMDLGMGDPGNGTPVTGWQKHALSDAGCLCQLWYLKPYNGEADTFTIQNLRGGTYLDLSNGSRDNGTRIMGFQRTGENQVWIIRQVPGTMFYKIQNRHSQTFVDLKDGLDANGTEIRGWQGDWPDIYYSRNQLWSFQRLSQTGREINTIINANRYLENRLSLNTPDKIYWVVDHGLLKSIWYNANLGRGWQYHYVKDKFDFNDLALAFKSEMAKWRNDNVRAEEFGILCGVVFTAPGQQGQNENAYNFVLGNNGRGVYFFEPETGRFSENIGYDATLAFL